MEDPMPFLAAIAVFMSPVAIAMIWTKFTSAKIVWRTLIWFIFAVIVWNLVVFLPALLWEMLCDSGTPKISGKCAAISAIYVGRSLGATLLLVYALAAATVVVFVFCLFKELARENKSQEGQ
mgnify:FL=1